MNEILNLPNVVGFGKGIVRSAGVDHPVDKAIVVLVSRKLPLAALSTDDIIPKTFKGERTDVIEVGDVRALANTGRYRPIQPGTSIGHYKITAGTFGAVVKSRTTDEKFILSNNHVLANSNDAVLGDPIIQPGAADGGTVDADKVAELAGFIPIEFGESPPVCPWASRTATVMNVIARILRSSHRLTAKQVNAQAINRMDAAIARPLDDIEVSKYILGIGNVAGVRDAHINQDVQKSGRTTEHTTAKVLVVEATISVGYGGGRTATFEDQIITSPLRSPGDSGSLILDMENYAVALGFAGSDQVAIVSPIMYPLNAFDVILV